MNAIDKKIADLLVQATKTEKVLEDLAKNEFLGDKLLKIWETK